jgi:hypothetical protein
MGWDKGEAMPETLDLTVIVGASGDTTPEEIQVVAQRLADVLSERPEVTRIAPCLEPAPDAAKSGVEVAALGAMLLQVAPAAVEAVLRMVQDLLTRPGTLPTKVTVKRKGREVAVEFDPRRTSANDIAALARTLAADLDAR